MQSNNNNSTLPTISASKEEVPFEEESVPQAKGSRAWATKKNLVIVGRGTVRIVSIPEKSEPVVPERANAAPSRRANTRAMQVDDEPEVVTVADTVDNVVCQVCSSGDGEASLLLCDGCDRGFHTWCINMRKVPKGAWYCTRCVKMAPIEVEKGTIAPGSQVYFYGRVSTKGQASFTRQDTIEDTQYNRAGYGTQNNTVLEWALNNGCFIMRTWTEANSAYNAKPVRVVTKRPGRRSRTESQWVYLPELNNLVSTIEKGPSHPIVVYAVNRFSRNVERARALLKRIHDAGSWVYSITENMSSLDPKFMTLVEAAQAESQRLSQRIMDARKRIKTQGGVLGQAPFGYTVIRNNAGLRILRENPIEQVIVKEIRAKYQKLITKVKVESRAVNTLVNECTTKYPNYTWNKTKIMEIINANQKPLNTFSKDLLSALE
jgi:DNA invertase Pin-like site-specific DNA recombinase